MVHTKMIQPTTTIHHLDVVESLRGSKSELFVTQYEQPAAFTAATYGRLTGKPGVCISTLGPGMLNFCFISKVLS